MKRTLLTLVTFILLVCPALALGQMSKPEESALSALSSAKVVLETSDTALSADGGEEAIATQKAAFAEYEVALKSARSLRSAESGGKSSEYGLALYELSTDPTDASGKALVGQVEKWAKDGKAWLTEHGIDLVIKAVMFLVILLVFKLLAAFAARITNRALSASALSVSDLLKKVATGMVSKVTFFVGVLIALEFIGVNTAPLLAGIGVIGFVVGFALQDTLSNFASGVMILLYRPYDIGDVITAAGETGGVKDMSLVSTTLGTPDNQKLIIPNSAIWGGTIRNVTAQDTRRVDMVVGVSYSDDLDKAQEVLMEVVSAHELVLADPAPVIKVNNLGDSAVELVVRPWSKTSDYWAVYWDLTKTIKQRFDKEGISFPFPQSDVHVVEMPAAK